MRRIPDRQNNPAQRIKQFIAGSKTRLNRHLTPEQSDLLRLQLLHVQSDRRLTPSTAVTRWRRAGILPSTCWNASPPICVVALSSPDPAATCDSGTDRKSAMQSLFYIGSIAILVLGIQGVLGAIGRR
jgi:hypothetical protein